MLFKTDSNILEWNLREIELIEGTMQCSASIHYVNHQTSKIFEVSVAQAQNSSNSKSLKDIIYC